MSSHHNLQLKKVARVWLFANESGTWDGFRTSWDSSVSICHGFKEVSDAMYCTRGPTWLNLWFFGCHFNGNAGTLRLDERIVESINTRNSPGKSFFKDRQRLWRYRHCVNISREMSNLVLRSLHILYREEPLRRLVHSSLPSFLPSFPSRVSPLKCWE